ALMLGWAHPLTQMSGFFTKAALMTFGGAYAVLPYVYQGAVKQSLDPAGLLNPGKLRGWALRDQLELDSNPLTRATRESPTT
ncbi:hypothetical protein, partial [Klebsiella pneumoniae]|uniref:hypothetical protein n=1 Tax=Klebsiella pneumoniae TaxID=573 RepID=UPI003A5CC839|nr:hypothetical protein [Klebsiella pneumoniae]